MGRPQNPYAGTGSQPQAQTSQTSSSGSQTNAPGGNQAPANSGQADAARTDLGNAGSSSSSSSSTSSSGNNTATILKRDFQDDGQGNFRWDFETSDGTKAEQSGRPSTNGSSVARSGLNSSSSEGGDESGPGEVIQGSYSYKSPDGRTISLTYVADENGFQPKGDHLPTSPPDPNAASAARSDLPGASGSVSASNASNSGSSSSSTASQTSNASEVKTAQSNAGNAQQPPAASSLSQAATYQTNPQQYAAAG